CWMENSNPRNTGVFLRLEFPSALTLGPMKTFQTISEF
ncbi:MAG: hypothetical protein, partial [Olavius algarvensis Delta 4 endosymbiont]